MIDFTGWKYYKGDVKIDGQMVSQNIGITIHHSNGTQESRLLIDPEVQDWIQAGNTPTPADE